jgi:hypothetical protein
LGFGKLAEQASGDLKAHITLFEMERGGDEWGDKVPVHIDVKY